MWIARTMTFKFGMHENCSTVAVFKHKCQRLPLDVVDLQGWGLHLLLAQNGPNSDRSLRMKLHYLIHVLRHDMATPFPGKDNIPGRLFMSG